MQENTKKNLTGSAALRELYGNGNRKKLYNAAIRSEICGGDEVLDLITKIHKIIRRQNGETQAILQTIFDDLHDIRDVMAEEIKNRYQIGEKNG